MRIILLLISCLFPVIGFGQLGQIWQENFNNGCGSGCAGNGYASLNGVWTVTNIGTNGVNANQWYVSCAEDGFLTSPPCANACSSPAPGNATAHIGNVSSSTAAFLFCPGGDCRANYDDSTPAEATSIRLESPIISTQGYTTLSLSMMYILGGVNCSTDFAGIEYHDGTSWSVLVPCLAQTTNNCPAPYTGSYNLGYNVALPASANNNPNIRIAFTWQNDGNGVGTDPSFAIDNLVINYNGLALDLEDFQAVDRSQSVQLKWVVREGANVERFVMERSTDGKNFKDISTLFARDGEQQNVSYEWIDERPVGGKSYYRIRQEFLSGVQGHSAIISVNRLEDKHLSFESSNLLNESEPMLFYSDRDTKVGYYISDMTGRILASESQVYLTKGYNSIVQPVGLASGWCVLTVFPLNSEGDENSQSPIRVRVLVP
jgi:hypothetical protein